MAHSQNTFDGDGVTDEFDITFPYRSEDDVLAQVSSSTTGVTIEFITSSRVRVRKDGVAPADGLEVFIYRRTSIASKLVTYVNGILKIADLNLDSLQAFYLAQEAADFADRAVRFSGLELYNDVLAIQLDVVDRQADVTTKQGQAAASATAAAGHVTTAAGHVTTAAGHVTTASGHADAAAASALAAQTAADSVIWQDVMFLSFADSPFSVLESHRGTLFAVNATGGAVVLNLPEISTLNLATPFTIAVKKTDASGNTVTADAGGSDLIDGAGTKVVSAEGAGAILIPDVDPAPDAWTSHEFGTGTVPDGSVTFAKMQDIAAGLIGNDGASGDPKLITVGNGVEFSGGGIRRSALTGHVTAAAGSNAMAIDKAAITDQTEDTTPDSATDFVMTYDASATALKKVKLANLPAAAPGVGTQVGFARTVSTTVAQTTAQIPGDSSIPQNTEGAAYASLDTAYTPLYATSILRIHVHIPLVSVQGNDAVFALFQDSDANALAANMAIGSVNASGPVDLVFFVSAASTSSRTYKLRYGNTNAGSRTNLLQVDNALARFTGAIQASMSVSEIKQ